MIIIANNKTNNNNNKINKKEKKRRRRRRKKDEWCGCYDEGTTPTLILYNTRWEAQKAITLENPSVKIQCSPI